VSYVSRGVARNLLGGKRGSGGRKSPSGVQGHSPGGGLDAKPSEAGHMLNIRLNKAIYRHKSHTVQSVIIL